MAIDATTRTVIGRPLDVVASFAANPANAPAWYANIRVARWLSEPRIEVGARIAFEARFLGRTLAYVYTITEYVPDRRLVMRTDQGPFPMETTYEWTAEGPSATRMSLRNRGQPSGFPMLLAPIMQLAVRAANRKDLRRLKAVLESR